MEVSEKGVDTDIDIDHFLWTGDISSDETTQDISSEEPIEVGDGFSVTQKIYPDIPVISPSSVFVTRLEYIFIWKKSTITLL